MTDTTQKSNDNMTLLLYTIVGVILLSLLFGGIYLLQRDKDIVNEFESDTNSILEDNREVDPNAMPDIKQDNFPKILEDIKQI